MMGVAKRGISRRFDLLTFDMPTGYCSFGFTFVPVLRFTLGLATVADLAAERLVFTEELRVLPFAATFAFGLALLFALELARVADAAALLAPAFFLSFVFDPVSGFDFGAFFLAVFGLTSFRPRRRRGVLILALAASSFAFTVFGCKGIIAA